MTVGLRSFMEVHRIKYQKFVLVWQELNFWGFENQLCG